MTVYNTPAHLPTVATIPDQAGEMLVDQQPTSNWCLYTLSQTQTQQQNQFGRHAHQYPATTAVLTPYEYEHRTADLSKADVRADLIFTLLRWLSVPNHAAITSPDAIYITATDENVLHPLVDIDLDAVIQAVLHAWCESDPGIAAHLLYEHLSEFIELRQVTDAYANFLKNRFNFDTIERENTDDLFDKTTTSTGSHQFPAIEERDPVQVGHDLRDAYTELRGLRREVKNELEHFADTRYAGIKRVVAEWFSAEFNNDSSERIFPDTRYGRDSVSEPGVPVSLELSGHGVTQHRDVAISEPDTTKQTTLGESAHSD